MKSIASFQKPEQAHLLRAHLEGSGIAAYVRDEHTVAIDWRLSNAIGGVKVEVADEDYDAAIALIRATEPAKANDPVAEKKRAGKFRRYATVFGVLFALFFAFLVWRWGMAGAGPALLCSFIVAGCIAVLCGLFES